MGSYAFKKDMSSIFKTGLCHKKVKMQISESLLKANLHQKSKD